MATWDIFFPDVLVHAAGAPDPTVRRHLCRAARLFLTRTRAWTAWLDADTVGIGESPTDERSFNLPSNSEIVRIERATRNGQPFAIESFREVPADWTSGDVNTAALISNDLISYVAPCQLSTGDRLQVQASLTPSLRATGVPDDIAARYADAIAAGALSTLLLVPGVDDPQRAMLFAARFEADIGRHAVDAYLGHTKNIPRVRAKWV